MIMLIIVLLLLGLARGRPRLEFDHLGLFRILHLTDLHFGEDERTDLETAGLVSSLLGSGDYDVVAITGDLLSNYAQKGDSFATRNLAKINGMFATTGTPSFYVKGTQDSNAGNHDHLLDVLEPEFAALSRRYPLCLNEDNPPGRSNFVLEILSGGAVAYSLWAVDGSAGYESGWGLLRPSELSWLRAAMGSFRRSHPAVGGLLFKHTPTIEFAGRLGSAFGKQGEPVMCSPDAPSVLQVAREFGLADGLFVGHDHLNSFTGYTEDGILLSYGVKTGRSGYGLPEGSARAQTITLRRTGAAVAVEVSRVDQRGRRIPEEKY